jgi:hypothetical protein
LCEKGVEFTSNIIHLFFFLFEKRCQIKKNEYKERESEDDPEALQQAEERK